MDFNDSLDELNITLGDTGNVTFTQEEKERALTKAWNDSYVVRTVWNTAGTFSTSSYQTAIPSGVTTVRDVGMLLNGTSSYPEPIDSDFWYVAGSNIQWTDLARRTLTNGSALYIKSTYKLTVADTITEPALQEYVVALAGYNTLTMLGFKKANLFLKNDTTMGELVTLRRELDREVKEMRLRFARDFQPF